MRFFLLSILFFSYAQVSSAEDRKIHVKTCGMFVSSRLIHRMPETASKGRVIYIHGLGDSNANHEATYSGYQAAGLEVVAPNLPSHGRGTEGTSLNWLGFEQLGKYILDVEAQTRTEANANQPLLIAGWSTGALIALRMAQTGMLQGLPASRVGLELHGMPTPAKLVLAIRQARLSHNPKPPVVDPISPDNTLKLLPFPLKLFFNSLVAAYVGKLPADMPTLCLIAGDDDDFAVSQGSIRYIDKEIRRGAQIWGIQFARAKHWLDAEPGEVGPAVREYSRMFAEAFVASPAQITDVFRKPHFQIFDALN